jgi:hypothetical protein
LVKFRKKIWKPSGIRNVTEHLEGRSKNSLFPPVVIVGWQMDVATFLPMQTSFVTVICMNNRAGIVSGAGEYLTALETRLKRNQKRNYPLNLLYKEILFKI